VKRHARLAIGVGNPEAPLAERLDARRDRPRRPRQRGAHARARQHRLARRVKGDDVEREPGREDAVRRLGIDVHVELGRRGHVAGHIHGATHGDDAADLPDGRRVFLERERHVREGTQGDQRQLSSVPPGGVDDDADGAGRLVQGRRRRPVREVAEPVLTVVARRRVQRSGQRAGRSRRHDRSRRRPAERQEAGDVRVGRGDGNVPRNRRDDLDPDLGRAPGEEQGERVVDSGIGVDQDGRQGISSRWSLIILECGSLLREEARMNIQIRYCGE
jgi:hypothetical protein